MTTSISVDYYKGNPCFLYRPDWSTPPLLALTKPISEMSGPVGRSYADRFWPETKFSAAFSMLLYTRKDIGDVIRFFADRKGKGRPFWLPLFDNRLSLSSGFGSASHLISVEDNGYLDNFFPSIVGRYLYIEWPDYSYVIRMILDMTTTTITFTSAVGKVCYPADYPNTRVALMLLVRFDQDNLDVEYITDSVANVSLAFIGLPDETPPLTTTSTTTSTSTSTSTSSSTSSSSSSSTSSSSTTSSSSSSSSTTTTTHL